MIMTRKSIYIFLGLALGAFCTSLKAQDAHFSQYFASPLWTNPALTGQINGNVRLNALYRSQWNAFDQAYQTTSSFSADGRLGSFGLGLGVINQQGGGEYKFNTLTANVGGSYDIAFRSNTAQHLVVGVQAGIYNISTNGNATLGDQYVDGFGAIAEPNEDLNRLSLLSPDINFGLLWFNGSSKTKFAPFVGASAFHLLQPYTSFDKSQKLDMRFLVHGGVRYRAADNLDVIPHVMFNAQGTAYNGIAGCNVSYQLIDTYTSIEGGVSYRLDDAIVPYVGATYKDISFGVSYDANFTYPSKIGARKNAFELSLTYINRRNEVKKQFICPRL